MEEIPKALNNILTQGVLGSLVIILFGVIIFLDRRSNKKQEELIKAYNELQEKRLADALQNRDHTLTVLEKMQSTLDRLLLLNELSERKG